MGSEKRELIDALNASIRDLQQGIHTHCSLVNAIVEEEMDERCLQSLFNRCPKRARERRLETAIQEAIEVLEESRKAFKSKRLEKLRKSLTQVLIEAE
jgi:predicted nucleotide-binding protein (sugar kinase/HSP70/actin superfamily)